MAHFPKGIRSENSEASSTMRSPLCISTSSFHTVAVEVGTGPLTSFT